MIDIYIYTLYIYIYIQYIYILYTLYIYIYRTSTFPEGFLQNCHVTSPLLAMWTPVSSTWSDGFGMVLPVLLALLLVPPVADWDPWILSGWKTMGKWKMVGKWWF